MRLLVFLMLCSGCHAAAFISPQHQGQVLIFPVYTGHAETSQSLLSIGNSTDRWKAVRFRAVAGMNATPLQDINLYLRPREQLRVAVAEINGDLALVFANESDSACTIPAKIAGSFSQIILQAGAEPEHLTGFIEVIEMGEVDPSLGPQITCDGLVSRWTDSGGWRVNPANGMLPPGGGLAGLSWIIHVAQGQAYPVPAIAIDGYSVAVQHTRPDSDQPNLGSGTSNQSLVLSQGGLQSLTFPTPLDAISALFMAVDHRVEVHADPALSGATEIAVTLPTWRLYPSADSPFEKARGPVAFPFDLTGERLYERPCDQPRFLAPPNYDPCGTARMSASGSFYTLTFPPLDESQSLTQSVSQASLPYPADRPDPAALVLAWSGESRVFEGTPDDFFPALSAVNATAEDFVVHGLPAVVTVMHVVSNGENTDGSGNRILANYGSAFTAPPRRLLERAEP